MKKYSLIMIMLGYSVSKESYRVTKGIMEYRVIIQVRLRVNVDKDAR